MARQLKLDELNRNTVVTLVSVGVSQRQAALHVGCDASTITKLATRDEAFAEQLRDARRRSQQEPLELIKKHAEKSWRAAAWLLEKSHPHLYGKQAGKVSQQALEEQRIELVQILADEIGDAELLMRIIDRLHQLDEATLPQVDEATPTEEQTAKEDPASSEACVQPETAAALGDPPQAADRASETASAEQTAALAAPVESNGPSPAAKAGKRMPWKFSWAPYYEARRIYPSAGPHTNRPASGKPGCKSHRRQQSCSTRRGKKKGRR